MRAIVTLSGVENSTNIQGVVHLKQETPAGGLTLRGTVRGLTPGKHGQYLILSNDFHRYSATSFDYMTKYLHIFKFQKHVLFCQTKLIRC